MSPDRFCRKCGAPREPDESFCGECGGAFAAARAAPQDNGKQHPSTPVAKSPPQPQQGGVSTAGGAWRRVRSTVASLLTMVILIGGGWLVRSGTLQEFAGSAWGLLRGEAARSAPTDAEPPASPGTGVEVPGPATSPGPAAGPPGPAATAQSTAGASGSGPSSLAAAVIVEVTTSPPGAAVYLDGEQLPGETPLRLSLAPDLEGMLRFELPGHEPLEMPVDFLVMAAEQTGASEVATLHFELTPSR